MQQELWLVAYYLHLALFSAALGVYLVMTGRWVRRSRWSLAIVNVLTAMMAGLVIYEFLVLVETPIRASQAMRRNIFDVIWSSSVLLLPALARYLELFRDHKQDARAELVQRVAAEATDNG